MTGRQWEKSLVTRIGSIGLAASLMAASILVGCATTGAQSAGSASGVQTAPQAVAPLAPVAAAPVKKEVAVGRMSLVGEENSVRVRFEGDGDFGYSLLSAVEGEYSLDLSGASFAGIAKVTEVGDGVISSIVVEGGRAVLKLSQKASVEAVKTSGGVDLVVVPASSQPEVAAKTEIAAPQAATGAEVSISESLLAVKIGSEPKGVSSFLLSDGARLVLDIDAAASGNDFVREYTDGPIARIVMRESGNTARAVIEARDSKVFSSYEVKKTAEGFTIRIDGSGYNGVVSVAAAHAAAPAKTEAKTAAPAPKPAAST
ncbi:AMIN domain-containing protein, partial [bacterium]